jgi:hypothetical protein
VERKLAKLANLLPKTTPVPGFASALRALHSLGHPLHIITARPPSCRADVIDWLAQQGITVGAGPEHIIQEAWFVNTFGDSKKAVIGPKGDTESAIEREKDLNDRLKEIFSRGVGKGKGGLVKLEVSTFKVEEGPDPAEVVYRCRFSERLMRPSSLMTIMVISSRSYMPIPPSRASYSDRMLGTDPEAAYLHLWNSCRSTSA